MSEDKCKSLTDPLFHQYHIVLLEESILTRDGSKEYPIYIVTKRWKGEEKDIKV